MNAHARFPALRAFFLCGWMLVASAGILAAASPPAQAGESADLYRITGGHSATVCHYDKMIVPRGGEITLADLKGPGKVTYIYITEEPGDGAYYPGLVLKVFWDEERAPSINVPLWNFFGVFGRKAFDYQSALMQVNHGCQMCTLPMPFSRRVRFVLANDGDQDYARPVACAIDYEQSPAYAHEKSRLHAAWNRSNPVKGGLHTMLEATGPGQYVGCFLQVNTNFNGWWGEGDTIWHLDGQTMTHSPGTEDEFGSCWFFDHTFSYETCGYIQMEPGKNRMYRWYQANPVRFEKTLKVEIQNQHTNGQPTTSDADDYQSVAFWYQQEPHQPFALPAFSQRTAPSVAKKRAQEK